MDLMTRAVAALEKGASALEKIEKRTARPVVERPVPRVVAPPVIVLPETAPEADTPPAPRPNRPPTSPVATSAQPVVSTVVTVPQRRSLPAAQTRAAPPPQEHVEMPPRERVEVPAETSAAGHVHRVAARVSTVNVSKQMCRCGAERVGDDGPWTLPASEPTA